MTLPPPSRRVPAFAKPTAVWAGHWSAVYAIFALQRPPGGRPASHQIRRSTRGVPALGTGWADLHRRNDHTCTGYPRLPPSGSRGDHHRAVGVVSIGTLSVIDPAAFPRATVWSVYGIGYGFVPLVLPILGTGLAVAHKAHQLLD